MHIPTYSSKFKNLYFVLIKYKLQNYTVKIRKYMLFNQLPNYKVYVLEQ